MPDLEWDASQWRDERAVLQGPINEGKPWQSDEQAMLQGPNVEKVNWERDERVMLQGPEEVCAKPDDRKVIQGPVRKSGEWRRNTAGVFQGPKKDSHSGRRDEGEVGHDRDWDETQESRSWDEPAGGPRWGDEGPAGGQRWAEDGGGGGAPEPRNNRFLRELGRAQNLTLTVHHGRSKRKNGKQKSSLLIWVLAQTYSIS